MRIGTKTGVFAFLAVAALECLTVSTGSCFSTSNTLVSRSFDRSSASAGDPIAVTVTITNLETSVLRGLWYADHIPRELIVATQSVKIGGADITNHLVETTGVGDVYTSCTTHRWVLETPTSFTESNPLGAGATLEIVYSVTGTQAGDFDLNEFNWAGYYEGGTPAFGYSEAADKKTIAFSVGPPKASVVRWHLYR